MLVFALACSSIFAGARSGCCCYLTRQAPLSTHSRCFRTRLASFSSRSRSFSSLSLLLCFFLCCMRLRAGKRKAERDVGGQARPLGYTSTSLAGGSDANRPAANKLHTATHLLVLFLLFLLLLLLLLLLPVPLVLPRGVALCSSSRQQAPRSGSGSGVGGGSGSSAGAVDLPRTGRCQFSAPATLLTFRAAAVVSVVFPHLVCSAGVAALGLLLSWLSDRDLSMSECSAAQLAPLEVPAVACCGTRAGCWALWAACMCQTQRPSSTEN